MSTKRFDHHVVAMAPRRFEVANPSVAGSGRDSG
jgi:hypothetical protein